MRSFLIPALWSKPEIIYMKIWFVYDGFFMNLLVFSKNIII